MVYGELSMGNGQWSKCEQSPTIKPYSPFTIDHSPSASIESTINAPHRTNLTPANLKEIYSDFYPVMKHDCSTILNAKKISPKEP
jgi:hypothetical protein